MFKVGDRVRLKEGYRHLAPGWDRDATIVSVEIPCFLWIAIDGLVGHISSSPYALEQIEDGIDFDVD